jgi:hypothetical protein
MTEIVFEGWALLELMGHRQRAGYVKDVEMFGGKLLRIDIPVADDNTVTEFYGGSAIYALRPCTEEIARAHVKSTYDGDPRPVKALDYKVDERHDGSHDDDDDEIKF